MTKVSPRLVITVFLLSLTALACNLIGGGNTQPTAFMTATSPFGAPTVTINSPANNSEAVRGQAVLIQSTARDNIGVTRVELRVDGFIVNTVSSQSAQGDREFAVIQTWTPAQAGQHTVQVVAYRGQIASQPAQIIVSVRDSAAQVTATSQNPAGVTLPADNICRARVDVDGLNFRVGPGTDYGVITVLTLGNTGQIIGRVGDNSWWQLRIGVNVGWVNSNYTTETGDCSQVPIVAPPASPTPRPATATPTTPPTSTPVPGTPTFTPTMTPTIPDLVVSAITGPTALQLNASGTVGARYTVTVRNQGTGNSGQFSTSFQQPDGTVVQLPIVVNLAPGQTVDLPVDVTFTTSNVYRLQALADSGSQVVEGDEGNNVRTIDVFVAAAPGS